MIIVEIAATLLGVGALFRVYRYLFINVRLAALWGAVAAVAWFTVEEVHGGNLSPGALWPLLLVVLVLVFGIRLHSRR